MPGNPQECRENAKRCLELAQASGTQTGRERFAELAQTWLALPTDYEATNLLLANLSERKMDQLRQLFVVKRKQS